LRGAGHGIDRKSRVNGLDSGRVSTEQLEPIGGNAEGNRADVASSREIRGA
jgi:hypothetical protein